MYAQLGDIEFEALNGFDSYSETEEATIAQYARIYGKPLPRPMGSNLRELSIGMRLHQQFILVENARVQLRAYKDNGTPVTLIWGNGKVEGTFYISNIQTNVEHSATNGAVISCFVNLTLLEVPDGKLLEELQASAKKEAIAIQAPETIITFTLTPEPPPETTHQIFAKRLRVLKRNSGVINDVLNGAVNTDYGSVLDILSFIVADIPEVMDIAAELELVDTLALTNSLSEYGSAAAALFDLIDDGGDESDILNANNTLQLKQAAVNSYSWKDFCRNITRTA